MKAVIFAGGVGTRLWPLSRKKSPKQFEKIVGEKSMLQLTIDRLLPEFSYEDIYISTGKYYVNTIKRQLKKIPSENILGEPYKKDVGPAVGYMMSILEKKYPNEPVIILWSDHLIKNVDLYKKMIQTAGDIIKKENDKLVFIGQKARFASDNLGWIKFDKKALYKKNDLPIYTFKAIKYRPDKETAIEYFKDGEHCWNLGYFVTTPKYLNSLFKKFAPDIYEKTTKIAKAYGTNQFQTVLTKEYQKLPEINFDNAILEQLDESNAYVLSEDIEWTDAGAWEALKEALQKSIKDNVTKGEVMLKDSEDNLVYNYDGHKMIVGIDLNDMLVVNTNDVLLVTKKTSVSKIKKLVESLGGTEFEHLT